MIKTTWKRKDLSKRVWEIDRLRGLAIFLMVLDHLAFDFAYLLPERFSNFYSVHNPVIDFLHNLCRRVEGTFPLLVLHYIFSSLFFVLSGISCSFSKNNFLHSAKIMIGCALLDSVTYALYYASGKALDERILFGVLFALGRGVFFVALRNKFVKDNARILFALSVFLFCICISFGLYSSDSYIDEIASWSDFLSLLTGSECFGADFFPLVPYLAPRFLGAAIGKTVYKEKKSLIPFGRSFFTPLCFIGRNTRWVYLLHQPVFLLFILLLALPRGYRF